MRSLPTARAALRQGRVEPIIIARIVVENGLYDWRFTNAKRVNDFPYPANLVSVTPVSAQIDPKTRKFTLGTCQVEVHDDGWLRELVAWTHVHRDAAKFFLYLGTADIPESAFAPIFGGRIIDIVVPAVGRPVRIEAGDQRSTFWAKTIKLEWSAHHPADVIDFALRTAGAIAGDDYDATTCDPTSSQYTDNKIAHYNTSCNEWPQRTATTQGVVANALIDELAMLMGGAVIPCEDGLLRVKIYNPEAAPVRTWTLDDITDFEELENARTIVNRCTVKWDKLPELEPTAGLSQIIDDQLPAAQWYAYSNWASEDEFGVQEEVISSQFLPPRSWVRVDFNARATQIELASPTVYGLAGYRDVDPVTDPNVMQATNTPEACRVRADQPAYFQIGREILKAVADYPGDSVVTHAELARGPTQNDPLGDAPAGAFVTVGEGIYAVERGALATFAVGHSGGRIPERAIDLTMAHDIATRMVHRFGWGAPVVRFRTPLSEVEVEIGDIVSLIDDIFLSYGYPKGSDASATWEVIQKEIDATGDSMGIRWTLCLATRGPVYGPTYPVVPKHEFSLPPNLQQEALIRGAIAEDFGNLHVEGGLFTPDGGGAMAGVIGTGSTNLLGRKIPIDAFPLKFLPYTDTYISFDCLGGGLSIYAVPNGTKQPDSIAWEAPLALVTTDGSTITSVTDIRQTYALDGRKIDPSTIAQVRTWLVFGFVGPQPGGTIYLGPGIGPSFTTEVGIPAPATGKIGSIRARAVVGPGVGKTDTITVRIAGADSSSTTTITGAGPCSSSDTTHHPAVSAGDVVGVKVALASGSVLGDLIVVVEWVPS